MTAILGSNRRRAIMYTIGMQSEAKKEDTSRAIKIAIGAVIGFLGGTVLKFAVSIYISILFINVILQMNQ